MSILSKVKSAAKNVVKNVVTGAKSVASTVAKAISGTNNKASALEGVVIPGSLPKAQAAATTKATKDVSTYNQQSTANSNLVSSVLGGNSAPSPAVSNALSSLKTVTYNNAVKTINSGKQQLNTSSPTTANSFGTTSDIQFKPSVISSLSLAGASNSSTPGVSSAPIVVPSNPGSVSPNIDTTALAGRTANTYQRQADGTFKEIQADPQAVADKKAKDQADLFKQIVGEMPNVEADREVRKAMEQRQQIQEALRNPVNELNAVIAQQNRDLLQLRQTGSQEGVTEAVYGGQQSAINYNAAIRALPLQASIASLQGDLELATDYLKELRQTKSDQIKRQYEYKKSLYDSMQGVLEKEDQRAWEQKKIENERAYKEEQKLVDLQGEMSMLVMQNAPESVRSNIVSRINNATSIQDVIQAAGKYGTDMLAQENKRLQNEKLRNDINNAKQNSQGALSKLPTSIQGKVINIATSFGDKPNVRKYIEAVDSVNIVNGIDPKSKNPADHQQIVYAFAKALDPDSAVKEGEYDTIRKYAQSTISRYGKEITNAINGTGFLSENAIKDIQTTMKNTLESRKSVYNNSLKETKRVINNLARADVADDIMIDYTGGINSKQSTSETPNNPVIPAPDGQLIEIID